MNIQTANINTAPVARPAFRAFEVGKTYSTRSPCDYDCIISVTIAKRTKAMVTTTEGKRFRVKPDYMGEAEMFYPWGRYSMCPVMSA